MSLDPLRPMIMHKSDTIEPVIGEIKQIINSTVQLENIPHNFSGLTVTSEDSLVNYIEVYENELLDTNKYKVNYSNGRLYFHPSQESKNVKVDYYSIGYFMISTDRIYNDIKGDGTFTTMKYIADSVQEILDIDQKIEYANQIYDDLNVTIDSGNSIDGTLNSRISTANNSKIELDQSIIDTDNARNTILGTQNKSYNVLFNNWSLREDGLYETTVQHNLNTLRIIPNLYDGNNNAIEFAHQLVDTNIIKLIVIEPIECVLVVSVSYYNYQGTIANLTGFSTSNLIDSTDRRYVNDIEKDKVSKLKLLDIIEDKFTATSITNTFNLSRSLSVNDTLIIKFKGVELEKNIDYSISGLIVTLGFDLQIGEVINYEIRVRG